jgi:hypothetical protein
MAPPQRCQVADPAFEIAGMRRVTLRMTEMLGQWMAALRPIRSDAHATQLVHLAYSSPGLWIPGKERSFVAH